MHHLIIIAVVLDCEFLMAFSCGIKHIKNTFSFLPYSLVKGDTAASLPIISYSLTSYSPYVAELLVNSNVELLAKNDLRFIDTVYKVF